MKYIKLHIVWVLCYSFLIACQANGKFKKVALLHDLAIDKHKIAILQTDYNNHSKQLLANQEKIKILQELKTYVLHKKASKKNYSISVLIDGHITKTLFFTDKPKWFTAHEIPSKPFEETDPVEWMFMPVVMSSNDKNALYSLVNTKETAYKEPHFVHQYQGQTKTIEAKYINNWSIWNKAHYPIKSSKISKELKRAYNVIIPSSMSIVSLKATVKIDKDSLEILQWKSLNNVSRETIIEEFQSPFKEGDIIFQTSTSSQSKAIQKATNSPYSHMGIIYKKENSFFVYEAIQPVKFTPLYEWRDRGKKGRFVVKRLKNANTLLTKEVIASMKKNSKKYANKNYDLYFEWSNTNIYCSELVWKIYKETLDIEIGKLSTLSSFNLNHPIVKKKLSERYGTNIPMNEQVISPATMFHSETLITIFSN